MLCRMKTNILKINKLKDEIALKSFMNNLKIKIKSGIISQCSLS